VLTSLTLAASGTAPFLDDPSSLIDSVKTFIFDCDGESRASLSVLRTTNGFRLTYERMKHVQTGVFIMTVTH
jgi:hypothetical protein